MEKRGKAAQKLLESIENSKKQDLSRLIFALGIRQVGAKAGKTLSSAFGSMDALMSATLEELTEVPDVGAVTAQNILDWFAQPQSRHLIARLRGAGVNFSSNRQQSDGRFSGMTFVLTGTLSQLTREEATDKIERFGGKVSGSVSKKTTYVGRRREGGLQAEKSRRIGHPRAGRRRFLNMLH